MSTLRPILQRIVLGVNRLPCGQRLTRIPYNLALRAVARLLRKYPVVTAAYARNSFALGTWVPGRSDIDLTLILDDQASCSDERDTVHGFWKGYAGLQRWLPMLGEVEILNAAHLDAWTRHSITGYEARFWLPVYGDRPMRSEHSGDPVQLQRDRLNHAISIYVHQMTPVIQSAPRIVLHRYVQKIMRYLDLPAAKLPDEALATMSRSNMQASIISELCARVGLQNLPESGRALDLERVLGKPLVAVVNRRSLAGPFSADEAVNDSIETILVSPNDPGRTYYILEDNLGGGILSSCIAATSDAGIDKSIILPRALFLHYLHFIDPLEYLGLLQNRTLLFGRDLMEDSELCPPDLFHQAVSDASKYILGFPYTMDFEETGEAEFRGLLLGWVARLARYFEDGVIQFDYDQLVQFWQKKLPDSGISQWQASPDDRILRFKLVRALVDSVSAGLNLPPTTPGP